MGVLDFDRVRRLVDWINLVEQGISLHFPAFSFTTCCPKNNNFRPRGCRVGLGKGGRGIPCLIGGPGSVRLAPLDWISLDAPASCPPLTPVARARLEDFVARSQQPWCW